jgi:ABC-type proline/glycine betaine transport system ATPase subunit
MDKARIVQLGTPEEIIGHPANPYVEDFVVGNLHKKIASLSKYAAPAPRGE